QAAVRRDHHSAWGQARPGRRGAAAQPGRRRHHSSRPVEDRRGFRLAGDHSAGSRRRGDHRLLQVARHRADLHPPEAGRREGIKISGRVLVVGGAGFVGSNLVRRLLADEVDEVVVVDNLLSAERENIPADGRVQFVEGSIADAGILDGVSDSFDYIWHLATYHGNQSSIANPLEDHENNLITTLRLLERVRDFKRLKKLVYAASGCVLAPHTFEDAKPVEEDGDAPFDLDSPYQISKIVGEFYCVYYHKQHG